MTIKEIFGEQKLSYDEFMNLSKESKFIDLSEGNYVSKQKYDDLSTQIEDLNGTITTRDNDLKELQKKLEDAGTDSTKLTELNTKFSDLQGKYDADTKAYQEKLDKQAYEFAVKEFANSKKFTSNAAKRDFINSLVAENLKLDENGIMGANDFVKKYTETNADAFATDTKPQIPTFIKPTQGTEPPKDTGFSFNFTGIRPHEK